MLSVVPYGVLNTNLTIRHHHSLFGDSPNTPSKLLWHSVTSRDALDTPMHSSTDDFSSCTGAPLQSRSHHHEIPTINSSTRRSRPLSRLSRAVYDSPVAISLVKTIPVSKWPVAVTRRRRTLGNAQSTRQAAQVGTWRDCAPEISRRALPCGECGAAEAAAARRPVLRVLQLAAGGARHVTGTRAAAAAAAR